MKSESIGAPAPWPSTTTSEASWGPSKRRSSSMALLGQQRRVVSVDDSTLHHEADAGERGDVPGRVSVDGDQVGFPPRGDPADLLREAHRLGRERSRRRNGVKRSFSPLDYAADELLGIASVSAGDGVRAEHDFETGSGDGAPERL